MEKKLYHMMNWPEIESIIYSECDHPHDILGAHLYQGGILVQAFFPKAKNVLLKFGDSKTTYEMECADEEGFFAYWLNRKEIPDYEYVVEYENEKTIQTEDTYRYLPHISAEEEEKLEAGILYSMYRILGAHIVTMDGVQGTKFIVYAPNAQRVSVVGNFNAWDGRLNQMTKITQTGIFAAFIPHLSTGELYKFEVKIPSGLTFVKRDPFCFQVESGRKDASVVSQFEQYSWHDADYIKARNKSHKESCLLSICEVDLYDYCKKENEGHFNNEAVQKLVEYVTSFKFQAVQLHNITKCHNKEIGDLVTASLYACGLDEGWNFVKDVINALHQKQIRVLMDFTPARFNADNSGLIGFDGSKLYENANEKSIMDGMLSFAFSSKYVRNYLISVAIFLLDELHIDGIMVCDMDKMMYLDYGKFDGEWIPNMYGGNENLDAIEFIKHLNSVVHKQYPGIITIAEDSLSSNNLTTSLEQDGLGFDYKIQMNFDVDLMKYMENEPYFRAFHHDEITLSTIYAYCERFILSFSYKRYGMNLSRMMDHFPGNMEEQKANLRLAVSYLFVHPGRKSLPYVSNEDENLKHLIEDLNSLYQSKKQLFELDDTQEGFEWINCIDTARCVFTFRRKSKEEELLVVVNFSNVLREYEIGLEKQGSYHEIFMSNSVRYGGHNKISNKVRETKSKRCDLKDFTLNVRTTPMSITIYERI